MGRTRHAKLRKCSFISVAKFIAIAPKWGKNLNEFFIATAAMCERSFLIPKPSRPRHVCREWSLPMFDILQRRKYNISAGTLKRINSTISFASNEPLNSPSPHWPAAHIRLDAKGSEAENKQSNLLQFPADSACACCINCSLENCSSVHCMLQPMVNALIFFLISTLYRLFVREAIHLHTRMFFV